MQSGDPIAVFLSDSENHFSDILYFNFRVYKKKLLWEFLQNAVHRLNLPPSETFQMVDVGASMGFDALFLLRKLTANFRNPLPWEKVFITLLEGDPDLAAGGTEHLKRGLPPENVDFVYHQSPLVEKLPITNESQHLAICSEVVEHLENPGELFSEIHRILKPGGFLLFTTDNSPNFLQLLKRIPTFLRGKYDEVYPKPRKEDDIVARTTWQGKEYPIYGHINLNPTRTWEKLTLEAGFEIASYGTYESVRRGGGSKTPLGLAFYFGFGALAHCLPRSLGRFFGDTTALLLRKPAAKH